MEVIILAGGLGTRLRSVVSEVPKCMAPVAGKPFLWYLLRYLTRYDVSRVILSVGYLREVIFRWIDEVRGEFPFTIDYAVEETPLGTGGGIRLAMQLVHSDAAVILNGDTYFDVDLALLSEQHLRHPEAQLVLALKPMQHFDRYGTVVSDENDRILAFREKQPCEAGVINGGVYWLRNIPADKPESLFYGLPEKFSFETEVLTRHCGANGCLFGMKQDTYFIDIGIPEDYKRAELELPALIQ
jgi:D-glycero-alpha-D-manno-heptose 1-phosphate guanylyltransferase